MNHNKRKTSITLPWKYPIITMVSFTPLKHTNQYCAKFKLYLNTCIPQHLKIPIYCSFPPLHVTSLSCELFSTLK